VGDASDPLPAGLSMLWEPTDPAAALSRRFGFDDLDGLGRWTTAALASTWGLPASGAPAVSRAVISDRNAVVWAGAGSRAVVVKLSCAQERFERLAASTQLVVLLAEHGVPVAAPLVSADGRVRVVLPGPAGPLSLCVLPEVAGDWLDVADPAAVRSAGACLARVHAALAQAPTELVAALAVAPPGLAGATAATEPRAQVAGWLAGHDPGHVPEASRRLASLLEAAPVLDDAPQLVHGDFRAANVLVRGTEVAAVLDLDEVALRHRVADLAQACTYLATRFTGWGPTPPAARAVLVEGYESVRRLSAAERSWLDVLLLWNAVVAVPGPDDPAGWARAVLPTARRVRVTRASGRATSGGPRRPRATAPRCG